MLPILADLAQNNGGPNGSPALEILDHRCDWRLMRGILSIQSEMVYGHVGNSAARFALQRLGYEVWGIPTVLYSNHPGHGDFAGENIHPAEMTKLGDALDRQGHLSRCDAVLTGYARTAGQVAVMADAVTRVKQQSPGATFCCDPVLGDVHTGAYVPLDVANAIPKDLLPRADILTPNLFELEGLSGVSVTDAATAVSAARTLPCPLVLCTSIPDQDKMTTLAVTQDDAWMVSTDVIANAPHGVGDLVAALFLGHRLDGADIAKALGLAVGAVFRVIEKSAEASSNELLLVHHQDILVNTTALPCKKVMLPF